MKQLFENIKNINELIKEEFGIDNAKFFYYGFINNNLQLGNIGKSDFLDLIKEYQPEELTIEKDGENYRFIFNAIIGDYIITFRSIDIKNKNLFLKSIKNYIKETKTTKKQKITFEHIDIEDEFIEDGLIF